MSHSTVSPIPRSQAGAFFVRQAWRGFHGDYLAMVGGIALSANKVEAVPCQELGVGGEGRRTRKRPKEREVMW